MRVTRYIIPLAVSWLFSLFSLASEDWAGVWRLTQFAEESADGVYHLSIQSSEVDGIQVEVYDGLVRELTVKEFEMQGTRLEMTLIPWFKQPLPLSLEMNRHGDRLEGRWSFLHPQLGLEIGGMLAGMRLPYLRPDRVRKKVRSLSDEAGVVDLWAILLEAAPLESREEFFDFWNRSFEPRYYILFHEWLYGLEGSERLKEERLDQLYARLRQSDADRIFFDGFGRHLKEAYQEIQQRFPGRATEVHLVSGFSSGPATRRHFWTRPGEAFDAEGCGCRVDLSEDYLVLDPSHYAPPGEWAGLLWKKDLVTALFWGTPQGGPAVKLYRRGVALYLALELEGRSFPAFPAGRLAEHRRLVKEALAEPAETLDRRLFPEGGDLSESAGYVIGYDFARYLFSRRKPGEATHLLESDLVPEWNRYLASVEEPLSSQ